MKKPIIFKSKIRNKIKQYFFRVNFKKTEKIKWTLKIILKCKYLEKQFKILAIFYLINILKTSSITKHKNICLLSSWKKSVNTYVKLNRMMFLENSSRLYIPGIITAKW